MLVRKLVIVHKLPVARARLAGAFSLSFTINKG